MNFASRLFLSSKTALRFPSSQLQAHPLAGRKPAGHHAIPPTSGSRCRADRESPLMQARPRASLRLLAAAPEGIHFAVQESLDAIQRSVVRCEDPNPTKASDDAGMFFLVSFFVKKVTIPIVKKLKSYYRHCKN